MQTDATDRPPSSPEALPERLFSPRLANAALPLVERVARDVTQFHAQLAELGRRYAVEKLGALPDQALLNSTRLEMRRLEVELAACRRELEELGAALEDARLGYVDFPSVLEGERVLLCWQLGEERVEHWHPPDEGAAGRRPYPVPVHAD
jgi:hypothetical protein